MANQEFSSTVADKESEAFPSHVSLDIPVETAVRRRTLHRVPLQVRENKKHTYDPVVVSLGPYHHGQPQFRQVEILKDEVLNVTLGSGRGGGDKDIQGLLFRGLILERVDEIRSFYGGLLKDEYNDEILAEMMLRDACLVLYFMESQTENGNEKLIHIVRRLGMSRARFMFNDFFMLENQIPLWVIKLLITLTSDDDNKDEGEALVYKFLSFIRLGDHRLAPFPWQDREQEPLHVLDAFRTTLFRKEINSTTDLMKGHCPIFKFRWPRRKSCKISSFFEQIDSPFGSVTELKAKGIHFMPSSNCLKDIRFSSYLFYGKLQLPICIVSDSTKVLLSNIIAMEMSPESDTDFAVTSYADFMKSLIENPKDVKELREKGIIFSTLANDEEVVKMFKEIDAYDFYNIFQDVKMRINEHCNSKAKTWMAELIHTYFRSPWNAIALIAATILLGLTFLQTYYAMNPRKSGTN